MRIRVAKYRSSELRYGVYTVYIRIRCINMFWNVYCVAAARAKSLELLLRKYGQIQMTSNDYKSPKLTQKRPHMTLNDLQGSLGAFTFN